MINTLSATSSAGDDNVIWLHAVMLRIHGRHFVNFPKYFKVTFLIIHSTFNDVVYELTVVLPN
jgi:hypothetical protein